MVQGVVWLLGGFYYSSPSLVGNVVSSTMMARERSGADAVLTVAVEEEMWWMWWL